MLSRTNGRSMRVRCLMVAAVCLLGGCATVPAGGPAGDGAGAAVPAAEEVGTYDPFEGFNRAMYTFNDKLDRYLLKPLAKGYRAVVPAVISRRVSSFFSNLREPRIALNGYLQGKFAQGSADLGRFVVNSTLGLLGLFDVATPMGLVQHDEDFGQTFAVWGIAEGPYLVLPFFGPSNPRDGVGLWFDYQAHLMTYYDDASARSKLWGLDVIDRRAQLLEAGDILDQAAGQDPYVFVREAYRQRRLYLIHDGNPPQVAPDALLFEDDKPAKPAEPGGEGGP